MRSSVPGYAFGTAAVPHSRITLAEFELMKQTALFGDDDVRYLRMSHEVLADQVEDVLDAWYGFIEANPHLIAAFTDRRTGRVDTRYVAAVRKRFACWILDTAAANYGRGWLDWQDEIGRRHHRTSKNRTDGVDAAPVVPLRYLPTLMYAMLATLRPFLAKKGHCAADVDGMHTAWTKSLVLQVTLWCRSYVEAADY
jgi:protoglobin